MELDSKIVYSVITALLSVIGFFLIRLYSQFEAFGKLLTEIHTTIQVQVEKNKNYDNDIKELWEEIKQTLQVIRDLQAKQKKDSDRILAIEVKHNIQHGDDHGKYD